MSRLFSLILLVVCASHVADCFGIYGSRQLTRRHQIANTPNHLQTSVLSSKCSLKAILSMVTTDRPIAALPIHKQLVEGKLDNGFTYVILPNSVPAGRFEAHLEVLSGSAHELEQQQGAHFCGCNLKQLITNATICVESCTVYTLRDAFYLRYLLLFCFIYPHFTLCQYRSSYCLGMAHLLEHVAYMGSPKRQLISGTGSRTNAYTDFHHTVFFAACPTQTPDQFWYVATSITSILIA